ncbi:CDP-diacylglycerol--glycerol-3-phosphate 3-phosphatidyltransferase [Schnuerera sp. xch1]|uniref:CDP-diacylglycerol--glycerol-3-phosphate 3-phosphatidyltransferase n=1 Tax=Schnuerera sp. xch1 TaxID=2874283 RepID=UPI001CBCAE45|nr:CDP-diacylglycerol--glycerol-3-phosphate 3-phosphatidyltransferase [Schnuerera sp. xch1]MBZ2175583.1 CDP-diacylglycerol--glycerol-3-phosphate 3-phosphatidyltransferase [Schnuerera sp. xch1]
MNIPNILTVLRVILVPMYLYFFFNSENNSLLYSGIIFIIAGLTDALDGRIARKYNLTSKVGAALDPLADKLMTFAVLISFTIGKLIPSWVLLILGAKEILMITGGLILYLFKGNKVLPSNKFGKGATISFYVAILAIVLDISFFSLQEVLIIITVSLNVIAFMNYLRIFLSKDKEEDFL